MKPIKFTYAEDGELTFDRKTCSASLMQLGALAHTAVRSTSSVGFATDLNGLEEAQAVAGSASVSLAVHVQSIGQLMAYAQQANIDTETWQDIGWMLTTFGQQLMDLHNLQQSLCEAIDNAKSAVKGGV